MRGERRGENKGWHGSGASWLAIDFAVEESALEWLTRSHRAHKIV